jgi:GAF domain/ANTAR domain
VTSAAEHAAAVLTLVANEPSVAEDAPGAIGGLQRLCRAARRDLEASGVGVGVQSESGELMTAAASSTTTALVEELQFTMGEGPCLAAVSMRRPVLVPDLNQAAATTWPGYGPAAHDHGVRAVFAFPLQVGAACLGALNVYRDEAGSLSAWTMSRALTYADLAMQSMLDAQAASAPAVSALADLDDTRFEVYQAQGMVMSQLSVGPAEALSRMRAHAYASESTLSTVADDIISRRLALEPDRPVH